MVLSASRLYQPLADAPNAMTVIDRKMIAASGARTLPELFRLVPGMYVGYYKGSQAFVAYHGSTDQYARRMQVMIDGRSVYLPPLNTVDWAGLPITVDDIERIEVIRGPAAASHGANSAQGVISIITRDASALEGGKVTLRRGNKGVNDVSLQLGSADSAFNYRLTLAQAGDHGFDDLDAPPNGIPVTQPGAKTLLRNGYDSNLARLMNFRAEYQIDNADSLEVHFALNEDVQGAGFSDKTPYPANPYNASTTSTNGNPPHDLIIDSAHVQANWLRQLGEGAELSLLFYHILQQRQEAFPVYIGGTFYPGPVTQKLKIVRDELELQHTLNTSPANRLVYGAAFRKDQMYGQSDIPPLSMYLSAARQSSEWRVFALDEWHAQPNLLINLGGMFERDGMGHANLSPRAAVNFHLPDRQTVRCGISVAYRTPALVEERFPAIQPGDLVVPSATVGSPGLRPEKLVSRELGYLVEFPAWAGSLDLRLFSDALSDGIYYNKGFTNTFVNGFSGEYRGMEATFKQSFGDAGTLTLNYAHLLASSNAPSLVAAGHANLTSSDPANKDILSASMPRHSGSLLYARRWDGGFSLSSAAYFQDGLQPFDRGYIDHQPVQRRIDLKLSQGAGGLAGLEGEVALVVQNLFDQRYTDYIANNVLGRRAYLQFTASW